MGQCVTNRLWQFDALDCSLKLLHNEQGEVSTFVHPRAALTLTYVPSTRKGTGSLYLFGGSYSGKPDNFNHLTVFWLSTICYFNLDTLLWTYPIIRGMAPSPREGHSAMYYSEGKERMIIYYGGGRISNVGVIDRFPEVVYLDLVAQKWVWPQVVGEIPLARSVHTASLYGSKMISKCHILTSTVQFMEEGLRIMANLPPTQKQEIMMV